MTEHGHLPGFEFTICKVAQRGCTAAKTITRRADGTLKKKDYDNVKIWGLHQVSPKGSPNANLAWVARQLTGAGESGRSAAAAMAEVLRILARRNDMMMVIGNPRSGHDPTRPCRRLWASTLLDEPNTLFATPRAWVPIDCDDIEVPNGLGEGCRIPEAAAFIRDHKLPPEFAGVECVAVATSSSGLIGKEIARLRLFFLTDQVHELARLRSWGVAAQRAGMPIDPALLQAGQPIYTARPTFIGMDDPVPPEQWAFVLPGTMTRVSLVADHYDLVSAAIERKVNAVAAACGGNWRKLLDATLGGPTSFFEPLSKALGLAAHSNDGGDDITAHIAALLVERADLGRQSQYGERWVKDSLRRFRGKDVKMRVQVEFLRNKLFG